MSAGRVKKLLLPVVLLPVLVTASGTCAGESAALRVADGEVVSFAQMVADVRKADIVLVGERHDSPEHHRMQLEVIKALHETGAPLAVGLEMFRQDSQKRLDQWTSGASTLEQFLPVYYDNWRLPWPLYRDIFLYSREHAIPMIGLNVPSSITRKVARQGFSSLTKEELKNLPPGISCNVDSRYREFISRAYSDSAHGSKRNFEHFCEAQMVWDKAMAWSLVQYLTRNPGRKVIVLAGAGHAWKRGIPEQVERRSSKLTYKVILPHIPGEVDKKRITAADADYIILN